MFDISAPLPMASSSILYFPHFLSLPTPLFFPSSLSPPCALMSSELLEKNYLEVEVRGPFKLVVTQEERGVAGESHLQCVYEERGKSSEIKLLTCRVCPY